MPNLNSLRPREVGNVAHRGRFVPHGCRTPIPNDKYHALTEYWKGALAPSATRISHGGEIRAGREHPDTHTHIRLPLFISKTTLEDRKREKRRTQAERETQTHTDMCTHVLNKARTHQPPRALILLLSTYAPKHTRR